MAPRSSAMPGTKVTAAPTTSGRGRSRAFILVCNPDVAVEPGAVAELLNATRRYPDAGFFAPRIVEPSGRVFFQARPLLATHSKNPRAENWSCRRGCLRAVRVGACFLVSATSSCALQGFDERIFLFYEDDDLCRRIGDASLALIYVPDAPWSDMGAGARQAQAGTGLYLPLASGLVACVCEPQVPAAEPGPRMFVENAVKAIGVALCSAAASSSATRVWPRAPTRFSQGVPPRPEGLEESAMRALSIRPHGGRGDGAAAQRLHGVRLIRGACGGALARLQRHDWAGHDEPLALDTGFTSASMPSTASSRSRASSSR